MSGPLEALQGDSPQIIAIRRQVAQLLVRQAGTRRLPPLLIAGETGTGKGLLARAIHQAGSHRAGPFIDVNCAAIPESLLEAELFGYERGAFTDARQAKPGLFHAAHGGTLFLDEIALLPAALQGKLLTALEDRAVRRLGSTRTHTVDIAVLAATSANLRQAVSEGRFREDLYHRLAVITLELPPLRSRGADVIALAEQFLARACADYGLSPRALGPEARAVLTGYSWPGNVRELANAMERVVLLSDSDEITPAMLGFLGEQAVATAPAGITGGIPTSGSLDDALRARIESALRESGGSIRRTATALGISRNTLRARMSKYGLPRHHAWPAAARPRGALGSPALPPQWERRTLSFLRVRLCAPAGSTLSQAQEVVSEKVQSFGGRTEEMSPSEAIAVFGLEPVDNAASHAALAALAIQNAIVRTHSGSGAAQAIVAIHCADHPVSAPEATARISLDGKAATWSELDRLLLTGGPGAIAVSSATAPFLKRRFSLDPPGEGRDAWRLLGRHEAPWAWGATGFVGRHSELGAIRQLVARVEHGQGQIAGVVGEAGIGKSRLLQEAVRSLQGWLVPAAGGAPYGRNTPYFPFQELLRAHCRVLDSDPPATAREKVLARLQPTATDPTAVGPAILDLLGLLPPTDAFCRLDGPQRRLRTHESIKQALLAASTDRPLCLIVEDLHCTDAETQAVLDRLANAIPSFPVLLLVSYRPGYQHAWGSRSHYTQVRLDPLPRESAKALLSELLGEHESLRAAVQLLVERSGGNPLFLEEHVRTLVETSTLVGERGAYRLATEVSAIDTAPTVQAIIAARIARLPPEARRVLQAAAVAGQDVPAPLLQAIADFTGAPLTQALDRLQDAEFISETRLGSDPGYAFRHALIHEAVYASLLEEPRRLLHLRALDALERLLGDRRVERVEVLAHHARCGEAWPRAAQYLYGAGQKALARAGYRIAGEFFAGAIEALDRHGPAADPALKLDAYSERWVTIVEMGSAGAEEHRQTAEQVLALADAVHDTGRRVRARLQYAQFLWARSETRAVGGLQQALELAHEAFQLAAPEDLRTRSYAQLLAGAACHDLGRLVEALDGFDRGAALFAVERVPEVDSLARPILANIWSYRAETLADLGDFRRAAESAAAAERTATDGGHPASVLIAHSFLAYVFLMRGHATTALPHLERALALAEELGVQHAVVASRHGLAHVLAQLGRPQDALEHLAKADEAEPNASVALNWTKYRTIAAGAYLLLGRVDQASREAETGYSFALAHGARAFVPALLRLRGEISLVGGDVEAATDTVEGGLGVAMELGLRAEEARLRLTHATLMERRGESERAGVELERAKALVTAIGMSAEN
jgi:transcriptional regulator with AAA-type ATPase domain/tetratricopeptide (TPR) repeat protein